MIGTELHIKAILRFPVGTVHDASIVDQDVNPLLLIQEVLGTLSHRGQRGKVKLFMRYHSASFSRYLIGCFLGLFLIPAQNDHFRPSLAHVQSSHLAYAGVCPCAEVCEKVML